MSIESWKIERWKKLALEANRAGNIETLKAIIELLEANWTDDRAAQAFYTRLEQEADAETLGARHSVRTSKLIRQNMRPDTVQEQMGRQRRIAAGKQAHEETMAKFGVITAENIGEALAWQELRIRELSDNRKEQDDV